MVAISAESATDSKTMKDRHKAPFLFIADESLELIDYYQFRNNDIAHPGFSLLHHGNVVWRQREMKFIRKDAQTILRQVQTAQLNSSP